MNNGIKFGVSNIKYSTDGKEYKTIATPTTISLETSISDEEWEKVKEICSPEPIIYSGELIIHKRKYGALFERCNYYAHHKKKRIRKKYSIENAFKKIEKASRFL